MTSTPPEVERMAIDLYTTPADNGEWIGCQTIAKKLGVSPQTVRNVLTRNGVKLRSYRESHANGKRCKPIKNLPSSPQPLCKCGCGKHASWNRRKNKWDIYFPGHYRKDAPYKDKDWLSKQYQSKSAGSIAKDCGVSPTAIRKFLRSFGIPIRSTRDTIVLCGSVSKERNPAWKGGVAKWAYAPNWKRIARSIRKRDFYTCSVCKVQFPKSSKLLHVHHIDGDKFNNSPDNLITVCATCHPKGKRKEIHHR